MLKSTNTIIRKKDILFLMEISVFLFDIYFKVCGIFLNTVNLYIVFKTWWKLSVVKNWVKDSELIKGMLDF